ncbi:hypothetical protein [Ornithinibacillus sp. JPR2-1]|uniref:hypothetical protein n=1 Tax=Ornithinibacillus sp. JPR2-1 TaxID=2094019 RepID=UPI0031DF5C99
MTIKAIETIYKGYRFRSRLEARWAVFFDSLGIKWEYEPEGFELLLTEKDSDLFESQEDWQDLRKKWMGKTLYYLPDFWLPDLNLWVEVKGNDITEEEDIKASLLAERTGSSVFVVGNIPYIDPENIDVWYFSDGTPTYDDGNTFAYTSDYKGDIITGLQGRDHPYVFCECPFCGKIGCEFDGRAARLECSCKGHEEYMNGDKTYNTATPRLVNAYNKARQARFEHGERPIPTEGKL